MMLIFMVKSGFPQNQCTRTKGGMLESGRKGGQCSAAREEERGDEGQEGGSAKIPQGCKNLHSQIDLRAWHLSDL